VSAFKSEALARADYSVVTDAKHAQAEHLQMKSKAHRKDAGRIIWSLMAELQQANIETKQTKAVLGWLQKDAEME
jgi:hypothetical protein